MIRYTIRRILMMPIMLLAISILLYFLINLSDSDPVLNLLGTSATPESISALREEMGLDKPLIVQYFKYMGNALKGDFGTSYYTKTAVVKEIKVRFPITLKLSLLGIGLSMLIGIPLGVLCAAKQYSALDNILSTIAMTMGAMPYFFIAVLLQMLFSIKLQWLPTFGIKSWQGWILPVVTLAFFPICSYLRYTRSSLLDTIRQDYVRTAYSKGNKERTVVLLHALTNALLPIITMTGTNVAAGLGGAIVIESIFSLPGLGLMTVTAIKNKDIPTAMSGILFIAMFYLVIMLIVDLLYAIVDPRLKSKYEGSVKKLNLKKEVAQ